MVLEGSVGGPRWDGSSLLIWLLGVGVAALAARLAAASQLDEDERHVRSGGVGLPPAAEDATLTAGTAFGFLVLASCFLLLLYGLIRAGYDAVLLLLVLLFVFATTSALTAVVTLPLFTALTTHRPHLRRPSITLPKLPSCLGCEGEEPISLSPVALLAYGTSFAIAATWFVLRRATWVWLLQDALSVRGNPSPQPEPELRLAPSPPPHRPACASSSSRR